MIVTGLGAVGGWFSPILHWGTWVLDYLQRADFLNTKFIELLRWLFSPGGARVLTGLFLAAFLVAVYRTVHPNVRLERTLKPENAEQIPVGDDEKLRGRITELESEKSSFEERIETLNAQHLSKIDTLKNRIGDLEEEKRDLQRGGESLLKDKTSLMELRDSLQAELNTHEWLHKIATEDATDVGKRVFVTPGEVRYSLSGDLPQIDFDFIAFNGSVYSLGVDPTPEGEITCCKQPLKDNKRVVGFKNLAHGQEGTFTLELRLSRLEADFILRKQKSGEDVFHFGRLTIKVNGGDYYPTIQAKPLKLPSHVRGTGATERANLLKAEYESEIGEQTRRAEIIEKLSYVLGMAQQVSAQFGLGDPVNKLALVTLNGTIGQALWACFDDQQFIVDGYYGGEPHNIPDSTDEQKNWVELHHHKLSKLIEEQRREDRKQEI